MHVEPGSLNNAREIAEIYQAAFPESVDLFFGKKSPEKLLNLLELTFLLTFYWGAKAMLMKDESGEISGYCLYSDVDSYRGRNFPKVMGLLFQIAGKITLSEVVHLLRNRVIMATSMRHTRKVPKPQARILSIAINPAYQGQGVGTSLFHSTLDSIKDQRIGLNVRADNPSARSLYAGAGFQECGTAKDLQGTWLALFREPPGHAL